MNYFSTTPNLDRGRRLATGVLLGPDELVPGRLDAHP